MAGRFVRSAAMLAAAQPLLPLTSNGSAHSNSTADAPSGNTPSFGLCQTSYFGSEPNFTPLPKNVFLQRVLPHLRSTTRARAVPFKSLHSITGWDGMARRFGPIRVALAQYPEYVQCENGYAWLKEIMPCQNQSAIKDKDGGIAAKDDLTVASQPLPEAPPDVPLEDYFRSAILPDIPYYPTPSGVLESRLPWRPRWHRFTQCMSFAPSQVLAAQSTDKTMMLYQRIPASGAPLPVPLDEPTFVAEILPHVTTEERSLTDIAALVSGNVTYSTCGGLLDALQHYSKLVTVTFKHTDGVYVARRSPTSSAPSQTIELVKSELVQIQSAGQHTPPAAELMQPPLPAWVAQINVPEPLEVVCQQHKTTIEELLKLQNVYPTALGISTYRSSITLVRKPALETAPDTVSSIGPTIADSGMLPAEAKAHIPMVDGNDTQASLALMWRVVEVRPSAETNRPPHHAT